MTTLTFGRLQPYTGLRNQSISVKSKANHCCFKESFLGKFDQKFCDVTFYVGMCPNGKVDKSRLFRISAHKCVIGYASPAFQEMFKGDFKDRTEVILLDIHPLDFCFILRYAYTEEPKFFLKSITFTMLYNALRFQMYGLFKSMKSGWCFRQSKSNEIVPSILDLYPKISELKYRDELMELVKKVFVYHRNYLFTKGYKRMSIEGLTLFVQLHSHYDPKQLLKLCLDWTKNQFAGTQKKNINGEKLKALLGNVIYLIQIPFLTKKELEKGPLKDGYLPDEETKVLLEFVSREGVMKSHDLILNRFNLKWDQRKGLNFQLRENDSNSCSNFYGQRRYEDAVRFRSPFSTDEVRFETNEDALLAGFCFTHEDQQVHSVGLQNANGVELYYKRDVPFWSDASGTDHDMNAKMYYEEYGNRDYDEEESDDELKGDYDEEDDKEEYLSPILFDYPIKVIGNRQYKLAVSYKTSSRSMRDHVPQPAFTKKVVRTDSSPLRLTVSCPATGSSFVNNLRFVKFASFSNE